ncbi:hypothetical protein PSTT_09440 [Puccinia striiformis]|uniref:Cleavage and polyadenylation specificity factor subunit 5 n=1 Tax=Puccinia striiformis TaxID=27350 RepID=A0A2S4V856_9BASI|nr:hypothetical protein PSTT_09440 [Puccinia striiformis]
MTSTITLYPLSNYTFSTKEAQPEEDPSVTSRLQRLQNNYEDFGMRRTVEGILVVHEHGHPHVLMLQIANAFFKLPGDYLRPGKMTSKVLKKDWTIVSLLPPVNSARMKVLWYVFDAIFLSLQKLRLDSALYCQYPYVPAHITKPKECKMLYLVQLPEKKVLSVPKNMKLLAIPLFELYDNPQRYGPQLAAIPHVLSRFSFIYA